MEFFVLGNTEVRTNERTSVAALADFVNYQFSDILLFSSSLYTSHCILFFASGLLLLTAIIGAITLATSVTDILDSATNISLQIIDNNQCVLPQQRLINNRFSTLRMLLQGVIFCRIVLIYLNSRLAFLYVVLISYTCCIVIATVIIISSATTYPPSYTTDLTTYVLAPAHNEVNY